MESRARSVALAVPVLAVAVMLSGVGGNYIRDRQKKSYDAIRKRRARSGNTAVLLATIFQASSRRAAWLLHHCLISASDYISAAQLRILRTIWYDGSSTPSSSAPRQPCR